jgi:predicted nucleic acid-binding protein
MPDVIANTSPLQYLFQLGLLDLLPEFYGEVLVPGGVVMEVRSGRARGVALPEQEGRAHRTRLDRTSIGSRPFASGSME